MPRSNGANPLRRILYLAPASNVGDRLTAYTFLDEEIVALAERGIEVHLLSTGSGHGVERGRVIQHRIPSGSARGERRRLLEFAVHYGRRLPWVTMIRELFPALHLLRLEAFAAQVARASKVEVIHSQFGFPGGIGGVLASKAARVPLVASLRGMDLLLDRTLNSGLRESPFYDRMLRTMLRDADCTIYASDFMRKRGLSLGAVPERTRTILKGVDTARFSPASDREALKARLGVQGPLILSVCGLKRLKGLDVTLRALSLLRDRAFTFVVCGEGDQKASLEGYARRLGISDRVHFVGRLSRSDVARYFSACDICILASRLEAAGNVLLEAMAAGRPVITTNSGGPPEYVSDGEAGFVVDVGSADQLRECISLLLDSPACADAMGRAGRARVEALFTYHRMIDEILECYHSACVGPEYK